MNVVGLMKHMFETSMYQFQECCWFQGRQWEAKEVSDIKGVVVHRAWYLGVSAMQKCYHNYGCLHRIVRALNIELQANPKLLHISCETNLQDLNMLAFSIVP